MNKLIIGALVLVIFAAGAAIVWQFQQTTPEPVTTKEESTDQVLEFEYEVDAEAYVLDLLQAGDHQETIEVANELLLEHPHNEIIHYALGETYFALHRTHATVPEMLEALDQAKEHFMMAYETYLERPEYVLVKQMGVLNNFLQSVIQQLAELHLMLGNAEQGLELFDEFLALELGESPLFDNELEVLSMQESAKLQRARMLSALGDRATAEAIFSEILSHEDIGSFNTMNRLNAGFYYMRFALEDFENIDIGDAQGRINRFTDLFSQHQFGTAFQSKLLIHQQNYQEAISLLREAITAGCGISCDMILGEAFLEQYLSTGEEQYLINAIQIFENLHEQIPFNGETYLSLGTAYRINGEEDRAQQMWRTGREINDIDERIPPITSAYFADRYNMALSISDAIVTPYNLIRDI